MQRINSVLLAAALIIGIAAFVPAPAQAGPCENCATNPGCFVCCRCDGGSAYYCGFVVCGSPDSAFETEVTLTSEDEGEILACTADEALSTDEALSSDEAPSTDEAPGTEEAPSTGEPTPVASR